MKPILSFVFSMLLFAIPIMVKSQALVLKVNIKSDDFAKPAKISVYAFKNAFTAILESVGSNEVTKADSFELRFEMREEGIKNYRISFLTDTLDVFLATNTIYSFEYDGQKLYLAHDPTQVNPAIVALENTFTRQNKLLGNLRNFGDYPLFLAKVQSRFGTHQHPFFQAYLSYTLAYWTLHYNYLLLDPQFKPLMLSNPAFRDFCEQWADVLTLPADNPAYVRFLRHVVSQRYKLLPSGAILPGSTLGEMALFDGFGNEKLQQLCKIELAHWWLAANRNADGNSPSKKPVDWERQWLMALEIFQKHACHPIIKEIAKFYLENERATP